LSRFHDVVNRLSKVRKMGGLLENSLTAFRCGKYM